MEVLKNFYCIEGINGAGKTSVMNALKAMRPDYHFTSINDAKILGLLIKRLISRDAKTVAPVEALTREYLILAARHEHIYGKGGIIEALSKGKKVITDRHVFSSIAYTGSVTWGLNKHFPQPEKVFFLMVAPVVALERLMLRDKHKSHYSHSLAFLGRVSKRYEHIIRIFNKPGFPKIICYHNNVESDIERIAKQIEREINENT